MGKCLAVEESTGLAQTNIALFVGDVQNFYRTYTTDVKILPGTDMNAGVLVNFSMLSPSNLRYHLALLDLTNSSFGLYYFNGTTRVPVGSPASVPLVQPGDWYRIQLTVKPPATLTTLMNLQAQLQGISNPAVSVTVSTGVSMNLWSMDGHGAGLYTRRSRARFSFWRVAFAN